MAEPQERTATARKPMLRWSLMPLVAVWCCALMPVALFFAHQVNPELAVEAANSMTKWSLRALVGGGALTMVGLLIYPPFPAWIRRFSDRVRRSWTVDRTPLLKALKDLEHFETAQKHFEVARLSWIRSDMTMVGPHAARAVELDPSMAQAHHLLGSFLLRVDALEHALLAFENAERIDPGHAFGDALLLRAQTLSRLGRLEQALKTFEQHRSVHGGGHRSHYWHAVALASAGRRGEAARAFREAAADPKQRLPAEENWFRALARVKCWRFGGEG